MTEISAVINKEVFFFKKKKKSLIRNRHGKGLQNTTDSNILKSY